jgi:hypothetical protein
MPHQVFAYTLAGKSLAIDVEPTDTILDLKRRIEASEGIPPDQQRLIWQSKQICSDMSSGGSCPSKTLAEAFVDRDGSCVLGIMVPLNIHVVLRLKGGVLAAEEVDVGMRVVEGACQGTVKKLGIDHELPSFVQVDFSSSGGPSTAWMEVSKLSVGQRECIVCCATQAHDQAHFPAVSPQCSHDRLVCKLCIGRHFDEQIITKHLFDVPCPSKGDTGCGAKVPGLSICRLGTALHFAEWEKAGLRHALTGLPEFRWCTRPGCGCGEEFPDGDRTRKIRCHLCKTQSCFKHRSAWHEGVSCEKYDAWLTSPDTPPELKDKAFLSANVRSCPTCAHGIVKNCTPQMPCFYKGANCNEAKPCLRSNGCNHMTCDTKVGGCGAEFCYICLAVYTPSLAGEPCRVTHTPSCLNR